MDKEKNLELRTYINVSRESSFIYIIIIIIRTLFIEGDT